MRYLVTGALGFLGTNLSLRLLHQGHSVVAIDDLSTGFGRNLELLSKDPNFSFTRHDVVAPFPNLGRFDHIYNLACPASPPRYKKDPLQTLRTSIWGAWNVLQYAQPTNTPVLHTSTSEVYGDPLEHPQTEDYWGHVNPIGVRACYDEGKRAAETLMLDFHHMHHHPVQVVRIFNTYGPYMDPQDGRVISNFITAALEGKPITFYGNGTQTRSFCYVDDLIDALQAMERSKVTGPINLGNPEEFTLLQLADTLEQLVGRPLKREFKPSSPDDPRQRKPDITLARQKLKWEPKVKLKEGLSKTMAYFEGLST